MRRLKTKIAAIYSDRFPFNNFGAWGRGVIWLGLVILGFQIGSSVTSGALFTHPVLLAGIVVVGGPLCFYFGRGLSFEKAFAVMILTLPLMAGFVIDIGGYVRISYLFAVLGFLLGLQQGKLKRMPKGLTIGFLSAFIFYALISTAFTFWIDFSAPIEDMGFRLTPFRSVVQAGQLTLMVMVFYLTLNYVNSEVRLRRVFNLVFWSTVIVVVYGIYDFVSTVYGLPFLKIISDMNYYQGGSDTPLVNFGGVSLPRPRSTFLEPIEMSMFLLFALPYSIASLSFDRKGFAKWLKAGAVFLAILLFFAANARSGFVAFVVVLPLSFLLVRSHVARLRVLLAALFMYLSVVFVLFPLAGGRADVMLPITFYQERLTSLSYYGDSFRGDALASTQIGRSYAKPVEVFESNPLLGVGLGNYPFYVYGAGMTLLASTHNMYLRLLTELGVIGTLFFLGFVLTMLWQQWKILWSLPGWGLRPFAVASLIANVGVMIAIAGTEGLYTHSYLWVMFAVGVGINRLAFPGRNSGNLAVNNRALTNG